MQSVSSLERTVLNVAYKVNVVKLDKDMRPASDEVLEELEFDSIEAFVDACYDGRMNEKFNSKYSRWTYCDYRIDESGNCISLN